MPDADHDAEEIVRYYKASGRHHTYLGDWHTHPNESPYLSRKDKGVLERIACAAESRAPNPLMAVLGGKPHDWILCAWCYRLDGRRRLKPLKIQVYDSA